MIEFAISLTSNASNSLFPFGSTGINFDVRVPCKSNRMEKLRFVSFGGVFFFFLEICLS